MGAEWRATSQTRDKREISKKGKGKVYDVGEAKGAPQMEHTVGDQWRRVLCPQRSKNNFSAGHTLPL